MVLAIGTPHYWKLQIGCTRHLPMEVSLRGPATMLESEDSNEFSADQGSRILSTLFCLGAGWIACKVGGFRVPTRSSIVV